MKTPAASEGTTTCDRPGRTGDPSPFRLPPLPFPPLRPCPGLEVELLQGGAGAITPQRLPAHERQESALPWGAGGGPDVPVPWEAT